MLTYESIVDLVAKQICEDCEEDDYETFSDMCKINWWDTKDIREYVDYIVNSLAEKSSETFYMCDDDGDLVIETDSEIHPYREFIAAIRKAVKKMGK